MGVRIRSMLVSVAALICLVVLLEQVEKSVALKCYACPLSGLEDCPNNNKGVLQACVDKDPICYEKVKRKPVLDKDGKPIKTVHKKGCMARAEAGIPENEHKLGCTKTTEHVDFCACDTDRCNPGDTWPERA